MAAGEPTQTVSSCTGPPLRPAVPLGLASREPSALCVLWAGLSGRPLLGLPAACWLRGAQAINQRVEVEPGAGDEEYLAGVAAALGRAFAEFSPDLVIYNAGTDILDGKPLLGSSLLSHRHNRCLQLLLLGVQLRRCNCDRLQQCGSRSHPCTFNLTCSALLDC